VPETSQIPTLIAADAAGFRPMSADAGVDLATRLQHAREAERAALARDLHDELGAILTAARLDVAWLSAQPCSQEPQIATRLLALRKVLSDGIGLKRRLVEELHPTVLTHLGFVAALETLLDSNRPRFDGRITSRIDDSIKLSGDSALALYRVAQESLTNILNYAQARTIRLSLARRSDRIELTISDDGRGFDPARVPPGHHGLAGLRDRLLAVHGRFEIDSAPGAGTRVCASVPRSASIRLQDESTRPTDRPGGRSGAPASHSRRITPTMPASRHASLHP